MWRMGRIAARQHQRSWICLLATAVLAISVYVDQVSSLPAELTPGHPWPTFPRRNIAALARGGYLRGTLNSIKRSISTLAKNGQLPTFRAPYDETDKQEQDEDESNEKRNMASIARLRSYAAMKRNVQALARDGYRLGRGQNSQQNDKRNIQSLARNGLIHKRDMANEDEYYYPFYQNPIPPLSEIDGPFDINELYDYQQSVNPDMFPPLSQVYKRSSGEPYPASDSLGNEYMYPNQLDYNDNWYFKRGAIGMPAHGLLRTTYQNVDPNVRTKRYILSLPDMIDKNDNTVPENDDPENNDKRSVGSIPMTRISELADKVSVGSFPDAFRRAELFTGSVIPCPLSPTPSLWDNVSFTRGSLWSIERQYISNAEAESATDPDYADVPQEAVPSHSHPTGRILHRPLNNDLPAVPVPPLPSPKLPNYDVFSKNRWQSSTKELPKFYYFRSLKVPFHQSGKRYLLLPAVDNIMLRKNYPNSSLPSRRKNQ